MSFTTPIALAWAALTIPIVIFYILKIRMRQVPVSTTIFWQQIHDEKSPRSLWQQMRHWISLLVQLVWLMLLVLALAEPYFHWQATQTRRVILVIDNSASMNATDVEPTRLAAAQSAARKQISALRFGDSMAVITAGTQPQVVCGLTSHERTLHQAVQEIRATDGPTKVTESVALARRLLGDDKHGRVLVFSDGGFADSSALLNDSLVEVFPTGTRAGNMGITQFQVRRSVLDPIGYEILVEVVNASDTAAECRLDLDLNDLPVDVIPLKLTAGQKWSQAFEKASVDGGQLTARLTVDDALVADNTAVALLPKRQTQRVLLITEGNLFLQKALQANPLVELKTVSALPTTYEAGVLHVFHRRSPATLPPGGSLIVDPLAGSDLWEVGEPLENPIVTKQAVDSPLMRHVRLDNVILPRARQLKPQAGAEVLVGAVSGDPLYFQIVAADRKALVLSVNLDEGDLTFRTAFPILVTNALAWFANESGELREALVAGAVTEVELPASQPSPLVLRSPGKVERPLPLHLTRTSIGPLDEIGLWEIGTARAATADDNEPEPVLHQQLACNLSNPMESDVRVPEAWLENATTGYLAGGMLVRPLWFYLIGLAWLLASVEWFLYQRRWIG